MNYLVSSTYNINFFEYNDLELKFMKETFELGMKYPFKWYEFINKIIGKKEITSFLDTTMIVKLEDLSLSQVKILFELLKEYLKLKLIKKILYKKEFIIVHFYSIKCVDVFKEKNLWISVFSYFILKKYYPDIDIYLRGVIGDKSKKELVDLVVLTKNNTYLINSTTPLKITYENTFVGMIVYDFSRNLFIPKNNFIMKFSFDIDTLLFSFNTFLESIKENVKTIS